jgi:hypothetical protein
MNGSRVGYIVGSFLEGFVATPSPVDWPDSAKQTLLEIAAAARETGEGTAGTGMDDLPSRLYHYPLVLESVRLLGVDNGFDPLWDGVIPKDWEERFAAAQRELAAITHEQMETLAMGEESEEIGQSCPIAFAILDAVFDDGELNYLESPWLSALDSLDESGVPKQ